jgi:acyl-coenzyme A thioesterase PaaI-like protein
MARKARTAGSFSRSPGDYSFKFANGIGNAGGFPRPVRAAMIGAEGKVIRLGRTLGCAECEIRCEAGRLVAKTSCTCMTLRGEQAAGR